MEQLWGSKITKCSETRYALKCFIAFLDKEFWGFFPPSWKLWHRPRVSQFLLLLLRVFIDPDYILYNKSRQEWSIDSGII